MQVHVLWKHPLTKFTKCMQCFVHLQPFTELQTQSKNVNSFKKINNNKKYLTNSLPQDTAIQHHRTLTTVLRYDVAWLIIAK